MKLTDLANAHVCELKPYQGGKPIEELQREGVGDVIKLASNEAPHPPSEKVINAVQAALKDLNRYPDGGSYELRRALSEKLRLPGEQIFLGAGSDEILEVLVKVFVGPGDEAVYPWPSFAMYPIVMQGMGGRSVQVKLEDPFTPDVDQLLSAVTKRTKLLFLANPNNPTGVSIAAADFERLVNELPEHVILVHDEAYLEYVRRTDFPRSLDAVAKRPAFVTLRTFSKIYGLAGLRIGYAAADAELIQLLERARHPFNVNSLAQVAAIVALSDEDHVQKIRKLTHEGLDTLEQAFRELGLGYVKSDANFVLVKVPDAGEVQQRLLQRGVITRAMGAFGLDGYLRVTAGLPAENRRFLDMLRLELGR